MGTLFSDKILTPPVPQPEPEPPPTLPLDRQRTASVPQLPKENDELTQTFQNQPEPNDHTFYTHGEPQVPPSKRRGNPRLLFMGMRRCGKSSVQKVLFEKMSPADTLYLEPTYSIEEDTMQSFMQFESAEIPTQLPVLSPEYDHAPIFSRAGAVVWIIDSQDEYLTSINELLRTAMFLTENYPRVNLEVFIHKTDGLSEEYKYDTFREVRQRVQDELADYGYGHRSISYYQTSIFDHSIGEAMSKVIQKLLPQLPYMERLLTSLCAKCRIQKAYLFDTINRIYVATDVSPTFFKDYVACFDYIDAIVDIKQLYGWHGKDSNDRPNSDQDATKTPFAGESLITMDKSGDAYMMAREINESLSLVCIMGKGSSVDRRALIDHNVGVLCDAMIKILNVSK